MTLIAAFIEDECPVLMGDLVTSAPGTNSLRSLPIWQRPDLNIEVEGGLRLAGLAQKVVIVSDRLCVAWTGPVHRANSLLRYLREAELANPAGSLVEVFQGYPAHDFGDLEMVAIGYEPGGWRTFYSPAMVTMEYGPFKSLCIGGSGTSAFLRLLDDGEFGCQGDASNVYFKWVTQAQGIAGQLMAKQRIEGYGLGEGWGGGFEIAYYDHGRSKFTKVSNTLYCNWELNEVGKGEYSFDFLAPFLFQWSEGEYTAFWSDSPGVEIGLHVVGPPWRQSEPFPFSTPLPEMTFLPDSIFNFVKRQDLDGTGGVGCMVRTYTPDQRAALIKVQVPNPGGPKTILVTGNTLSVEVAETFVPPEAKVVEYRWCGATVPWPPDGILYFEEEQAPVD